MNRHGCDHFAEYVDEWGLGTYNFVHAIYSSGVNNSSRRQKALTCLCSTCGGSGPQLYACLHCVFFGCKGFHISEHRRETNHYISLELCYGVIFCSVCNDFLYDTTCTLIAESHQRKQEITMSRLIEKRPWIIPDDEVPLLHEFSSRRLLSPTTTVGLRGLTNLGSTCFMNCIVQALIHTPAFRDYFLAERHECRNGLSVKCLVCEVSRLFQEFYSGAKGPVSLHRVLHLIWNHAKHLAGYEQQDAHEFFIATLDVLHRHCKDAELEGDKSNTVIVRQISDCPAKNGPANECSCIIDQIFMGYLQSDVVCQACNGVSRTIEKFLDISLDLGEVQQGWGPPKSLADCLERFTRAEHLGSSAKIKCSACNTYQESTKQLSMRTLPIVASFHLKRFEHSSNVDRKISTFISFPYELDMTPYVSDTSDISDITDCRYHLYAVINHIGSFGGGHYTAYVRHHRDVWVKCDDHMINLVPLKQVLDSEGYMLFYHKKVLEYE